MDSGKNTSKRSRSNVKVTSVSHPFLSAAGKLLYHTQTLYLFIRSDIKTIIIPVTSFAIFGTPHVRVKHGLMGISWLILHLLLIDIDNQSLSMQEDMINKPWRPLPSGRVNPGTAELIARLLYPICMVISWLMGSLNLLYCSACFCLLVYIYDHLKLNSYWVTKNVVNGLGYMTLEMGTSLIVANGTIKSSLLPAILVSGSIIATTVPIQDLQDEAGDRAIGRYTMIMQFGHFGTRLSISLCLLMWSLSTLVLFQPPGLLSASYTTLGLYVAYRNFLLRTVSEDEKTYRIYNVSQLSFRIFTLVNFLPPDMASVFIHYPTSSKSIYPVLVS
ncbi:UbiA prenyltransferase family-domain-containing protein [Hysterangium stoloniferum]|nr:UbiA prenyltransferase family-domain-containing protein [Hysterangium stoloniferum]